jgi:hypothetical protein
MSTRAKEEAGPHGAMRPHGMWQRGPFGTTNYTTASAHSQQQGAPKLLDRSMIVAAAAATTKKQGWRQCFKVSPVPASPVLILIGEKTHEKQAA